jgi:hypothetical protein
MIENMVQGTMYITTKHVCFHSTFWGTERKVRFLLLLLLPPLHTRHTPQAAVQQPPPPPPPDGNDRH